MFDECSGREREGFGWERDPGDESGACRLLPTCTVTMTSEGRISGQLEA